MTGRHGSGPAPALQLAPGRGMSAARPGGPFCLVLLRHGESEWNAQDGFTGWVDVALTGAGDERRTPSSPTSPSAPRRDS